jgi:N utilization substance protein B
MSSRRVTSRTRARKRAIDTIFEADQRDQMTPGGILDLLDDRRQVTPAQTPLPDYAIQIVEGVAEHIYQIDDLLTVHTTNRDFDRLPSADRAVLRAATWEIIWNDDVDAVTAIDEAITIVKDISTDESPSVVNGILDAVRKNAAEIQATDDAFQAALAPRDDVQDEKLDDAEYQDPASETAPAESIEEDIHETQLHTP